jgi:hypothetical protein
MMRGSTPAVAAATIRARGVRFRRNAASADATSSAQAPSLTPEALPAVTLPLSRNGVASAASCSSVVSGRGCSSRVMLTDLPLRCGISTASSSLAKKSRA